MKTKEQLLNLSDYYDEADQVARRREWIEVVAETLIDIRDILDERLTDLISSNNNKRR